MLTGGIITSFFLTFTVMADALIAGIRLGEDAVIGVNLVLPVYSLASFFALLFSIGVPILYSKEIGAFEKEEAERSFGVGIFGTIVTGVVLFLLLVFCGNIYLDYLGADSSGLLAARDYLFWIKYVVLIAPFEALLSGMVFADGDEFLSTLANLIAAVGNIILSILLAGIMGAGGLGLASFLSLVASIAVSFLHFTKKRNSLHLNIYFSTAKLRNIARYSIVNASIYLFLMMFSAVLNRYVAGAFGSDMLILVSVIAFIKEAQFLFDGVGDSVAPIISVYLGEKTYQGVSEVWKLARRTAAIESVIVTAAIIMGAPIIVRFLGIEDPQKAQIAVLGLRMMSLTLIFASMMYLDSSYYVLIDKIPLGILICALRDLVSAVPLAVLGGKLWGIYGMFTGLMIAPAVGYLLSYLYICFRYDKESYALFIPPIEKERHIWMYEFEVRPDLIIQARDQIGETLKNNGRSSITVNRVMMLFEELFMLVYDLNPGKTVLAECVVEAGDKIHIITKDNGIYYDIMDPDRQVGSFRSFIVSGLTEKLTNKRINLVSLSFNRNSFEVE